MQSHHYLGPARITRPGSPPGLTPPVTIEARLNWFKDKVSCAMAGVTFRRTVVVAVDNSKQSQEALMCEYNTDRRS